MTHVRGGVTFDGVDFAYVPGHPVLHDVGFRVPAGDTFAIVGATGSGKTTIVKLLLRYYDPTRGTVNVDGRDITKVQLRDVRQAIALVSQDVFLFHGTVWENIVYGRPEATPDEVERAAQIAEARDFILKLPDGYETIVGERGQKLSGGQRQRLSIARALVSNAPILVLDEATSAVDNETEAAIQRSLAQVAHNKTTIVIAHRLSTIRHADQIAVFEEGRITQRGTHDELIEVAGLYRTLWSVQTGEAV
jgi:ATP-binding cassette subfamily B protein